jgi:hypothetical protein
MPKEFKLFYSSIKPFERFEEGIFIVEDVGLVPPEKLCDYKKA